MSFAIKAEIGNVRAKTLQFTVQKTMYGGKRIAAGDRIYIFASENEGGRGLIARGTVMSAEAIIEEQRGRPSNAVRQHHRQAHRFCDKAVRAKRT